MISALGGTKAAERLERALTQIHAVSKQEQRPWKAGSAANHNDGFAIFDVASRSRRGRKHFWSRLGQYIHAINYYGCPTLSVCFDRFNGDSSRHLSGPRAMSQIGH
jgi:hypothetical protein